MDRLSQNSPANPDPSCGAPNANRYVPGVTNGIEYVPSDSVSAGMASSLPARAHTDPI